MAFASKLEARAYPSLRLTHEVLPGETHLSVFNAGLSNGVRRLFGAFVVLYGLSIVWLYPAYLSDILPLVREVYVLVRFPVGDVMGRPVIVSALVVSLETPPP